MASSARITRRRVEFPSSRQEGVTLVGELVSPDRPPSTSSPLPVAILQHGLADDRDGFVLPRIAEALATRASCSSLRFDFRGNGESGGQFRFGNAATGDVDDVEDAVSFLLRENFDVVALVGHSKAGSTVVAYASRRKRGEEKERGKSDDGDVENADDADDPLFVPLVVSVAARFDHSDPQAITSRFGDDVFERLKGGEGPSKGLPFSWRMGSKRRLVEWRLTPEDLRDRLETDMGSLCVRIPRETKLVFVHGGDDETVPPSAARRFADASPSDAEPRMIAGADHNFTRREKADELIDAIVSCVGEVLSERETEERTREQRRREK